MGLEDALQSWERQWRATGALVDEILAPGLDAETVRAALGRDDVHPDVLAWFGWNNGGATHTWDALPSGRLLLDLQTSIAFQSRLKDSMDVVGQFEDGVEFRESYLPILDNDHNDIVFVDLDTGEVYRWEIEPWTEHSQVLLLIGRDLESVVRLWMAVLDRLQVRFHPGQVYFDVDRSQVDSDLVDRGVCRV